MSKTISIRVDEETFKKYSSVDKEKFKSKFINLIEKFHDLTVNSCKQSVNSCKQSTQNITRDSYDPKQFQRELRNKKSSSEQVISLEELFTAVEGSDK